MMKARKRLAFEYDTEIEKTHITARAGIPLLVEMFRTRSLSEKGGFDGAVFARTTSHALFGHLRFS